MNSSPTEVTQHGEDHQPLRYRASMDEDEDDQGRTSVRSRRMNRDKDPEKINIFLSITRSGWLLLFTKFLLAVVVEKVAFENTIEHHVANVGLLLNDTISRFYCSYGIILAIGIPLGLVADCVSGKKWAMVLVLCLNIGYYFYMVVEGVETATPGEPELISKLSQLVIQTTLHSIRGIETAAMLESLQSTDYKILFVYTFLKILVEGIGKVFYVVLYLMIGSNGNSAVVSNFVCLSMCMVIFFIWILFVSSLKKSETRRVSLTTMRRITAALIWKARLNQKNKNVVIRRTDQVTALFKTRQTKTAKKLLYLSLLIIPSITIGFLYHASINIFRGPFARLLDSGYGILDLSELFQRVLILVMLPLVEFVIVPLILRQILRRKITFIVRLACSMVTGVVAYLYGVIVVRMLMARGSPLPDIRTSEVRFVNALNYSVVIRPTDRTFSSGIVQAKSDLLLTYISSGRSLTPTREVFEVQLESHFKYVAAVSLEGEECVTYFLTDFMEIQRVPGHDPIFEGPPGTNHPLQARMYFANLDPEVTVQLVLTFQHSTFQNVEVDEQVTIEVAGGQKKIFQIKTGTYILTIAHVDVSKSHTFGPGGVYGVIYCPEVKEETLNYMVVEIRTPKTLSIIFALIYECFVWMAISFIVVVMEIMVFLKSPQNWRSSAFSFYFFFVSGFLPLCHYSVDLAINTSGRIGWGALIAYLTTYVGMCLLTTFIAIKFRTYFVL